MTRLEKACEALRLVNAAESATLAREKENVLRLFAPRRRQAEQEWHDAMVAEGAGK